jgi:hypothetical protein
MTFVEADVQEKGDQSIEWKISIKRSFRCASAHVHAAAFAKVNPTLASELTIYRTNGV